MGEQPLSLPPKALVRLVFASFVSVLGGLGGPLLVVLIHRGLGAVARDRAPLALAFIGVGALTLAFRWASKSEFVNLSQSVLAELRLRLAVHFARAPYRELERTGPARVLSLILDDVSAVAEGLTLLPRLFTQGAVVIGCFSYLAWLSPPGFLVVLAAIVLASLGRQRAGRQARQSWERARAEEDELYGHFRALFTGAKELSLNRRRRGEFVTRVLGASTEAVFGHAMASGRWHVGALHWNMLLSYTALGAVVFWVGPALDFDAPVRTAYSLLLLYMLLPMHALLSSLPELTRVHVSLRRIQSTLARGSEPPAATPSKSIPRFQNIQLRGVTHRYHHDRDDESFLLGPVDLQLRPGEIVFLVGGNGSGKTTLAKLVVGLYEPEAGEVRWNGDLVDAASRDSYRQNFSAVFTDFHLFEGLPGLDAEAVDERARVWLHELELGHKVDIENRAFSTTQLSSGQRKRLALIVAMLENRPICCFDEWAADQDPRYKRIFYCQLLPALAAAGRAVIAVTHDDEYFHVATRCLKLDGGKLFPLDMTSARKAHPIEQSRTVPQMARSRLAGAGRDPT